MPYTDFAKAKMLTPLRADMTHLSLHTADPSTTGANEVTGGDPAYARVAVTTANFNAIATGAFTVVADIAFNGPASGGVTHMGSWHGTDFLGGAALTGDATFNAEGDYLITTATSFNLNG